MALELMVVDDSPVTRKMVRRALGLCGLDVSEVHEAGDGLAALEKLAAHPVDLVLADVNMPTMNGIEMVERMSKDPRLSGIPVVIVATPLSDAHVDQLLQSGARAYLAKPFRPEALREVVLEIVGAKEAARG